MLVANHGVYTHSASDASSYPWWVKPEAAKELARHESIMWVENPITHNWWPWFVNPNVILLLRASIERGIYQLTDKERESALTWGLIYDHQQMQVKRIAFEMARSACITQMRRDGYCVLPSVVTAAYQDNINYYFREEQSTLVPDTQVELRLGLHNMPLFAATHRHMTTLVQSVIEQPIKPSYCYAVKYTQGAELKRHTDRPQCKWNASITFAREGEVWPIHLEVGGTRKEVRAELGEVVVYSGTTVPHWRGPLESPSATVCFYHFVDLDYQGELR